MSPSTGSLDFTRALLVPHKRQQSVDLLDPYERFSVVVSRRCNNNSYTTVKSVDKIKRGTQETNGSAALEGP